MSHVNIVCPYDRFNGSTCTAGGRPIISLSTNEGALSDYATASCVVLAGDSPDGVRAAMDTYEGGEFTGHWEVESCNSLKDTSQTLYGTSSHIPLFAYKLKRLNWSKFRATLSKSNLGKNVYPLRFMTEDEYKLQKDAFNSKNPKPATDPTKGFLIIKNGFDIIKYIGIYMGVIDDIDMGSAGGLTLCAPSYVPADQVTLSAIKEVASWSGYSTYLDRNGRLTFYRPIDKFMGKFKLDIPYISAREYNASVPDITYSKVIGNYGWSNADGSDKPFFYRKVLGGFTSTSPGIMTRETFYEAIPNENFTEAYARISSYSGKHVETRRAVSEYKLSPELGMRMAQTDIMLSLMQGNNLHTRGIADGEQHIEPLQNGVIDVTRSLTWSGDHYTYEVDYTTAYINDMIETYTPTAPTAQDLNLPPSGSLGDWMKDMRTRFYDEASFDQWFESGYWHAHGYDKNGNYVGVPTDGNDVNPYRP
jgi:hypothetical protein